MSTKRKNAVPKRYRAYYIEPGLADYSAEGVGVVLVGKKALDLMAASFVGKPVVNLSHTDKEPEELFNLPSNGLDEFADGVVSEQGYDEESGWYWCDFLVWDNDTQKSIDENGYSVSCAYDVTEADTTGGKYHNVEYDEEVLNGEYLHLAIVDNPRYEGAWIVKNSLPGGINLKPKFFKKKPPLKNQEPGSEEEAKPEEDYINLPDGSKLPVSEAMAAYEKSKEVENATGYNMDDEIEVDGKKMTVADFLNACGYKVEKQEGEESPEDENGTMENAEDPQEEDLEPVLDDKLMNSKTRANSNFKRVKRAVQNSAGDFKPNITTKADKLAVGKARYGSPVKQ